MFFKLLFLFCVMCSVVVCNHDYELRVRVHSYLNPGSRCSSCMVGSVYSCCDNPFNTGVCSGEELCDTFFQYCLRALGETGVACPQNDFIETMFLANTDALSDIGDTILGSSNPFVLSGVDWRGAQFFIETKDSNPDSFPFGTEVKTIDSFAIDVNIEGGERLEPIVYQGRFGIAQIKLSFEVVCQNNYSLPNCAACEPGSSPQCISRRTAGLVPTTSATPDTPVIGSTVTLPPGSEQPDNETGTSRFAAIVGGVLGTVIIFILVLLSAVCLVLAYKKLSKDNHNVDNNNISNVSNEAYGIYDMTSVDNLAYRINTDMPNARSHSATITAAADLVTSHGYDEPRPLSNRPLPPQASAEYEYIEDCTLTSDGYAIAAEGL